jgi:raffinose/stachyose/melibiose transport system substrate-binding protein
VSPETILKETVKAFVEGCEGGFTPFNRGSLPVVSGIAMEVQEDHGTYTLTKVTRDGEAVRDAGTFTVTCLAAAKHMAPLLADESRVFEGGDVRVRNTWTEYVAQDDAVLAEPEPYISLR